MKTKDDRMRYGSELPDLFCSECGRRYPPTAWRCDCGGPLDLGGPCGFSVEALRNRPPTLWRYREALPSVGNDNVVSLGEGYTPLVPARDGSELLFKLDFLFPSGSFKDRGSTVLASVLKELAIPHVIEDSSGNAGASMAAYFAAAGIPVSIYAPATISTAKAAQIRSCGASLVLVKGSRADVTRAAQAAAAETYYGSHQLSPYFLAGTKTFAFEVWEQLGKRLPDNVVVPVGAGTLLLGAYLGFRQLREAGVTDHLPRLWAAQSESLAPLYHAFRLGLDSVEGVEYAVSDGVAEGIRVERPPRHRQILRAVRECGGAITAVNEREIAASWQQLARQGLFVEPTAAVAPAALWRLLQQGAIDPAEITVVALTGSGLKGVDKLAGLMPAGLAN